MRQNPKPVCSLTRVTEGQAAAPAGTTCPVCQTPAGDRRAIEARDGYSLFRCPVCDVVYSDPMNPVDGRWYQDQVMYVVRDQFQPGRLQWNHKRFLRECPARGGRLLDVGCGTGEFLVAARRRGYDVTGIDFDPSAVQVARKRHSLERVYAANLEDFGPDHGPLQFDVVTVFEVLEHAASPRAFLSRLRDLIRPSGYLVLSVPYRDRRPEIPYAWDFPPHHFTRWSRSAIENFLESNGFRVLNIEIGLDPAETLLHHYLRFGLVARLIRTAQQRTRDESGCGAEARAHVAGMLFRLKYYAIRLLAPPVDAVLSLMGATGLDMCVFAQNGDDA